MPFVKQEEPRIYKFGEATLMIEEGIFWADQYYKSFITRKVTMIYHRYLMSTLIDKKHKNFQLAFEAILASHKFKLREKVNEPS